jgi:ABC-type nitrate/sulfonate/bicarbonate transport system substrate-binding protein
MRLPRLPSAAALAATAALLAGCGGAGVADRPEQDALVVLAGAPQALYAPIATAVERGYDGAEGIHFEVRPGRGPDAGNRALTVGRAQFAVLPAAALSGRGDLIGIMALTNAPSGDRAPRLVLATRRKALEEDPSLARAAVRALLRSYESALTDPASSLSDLQALFPGLDRRQLDARFDAGQEELFPPGRQIGALPQGDPRYDAGLVQGVASTNHTS